MRKGPLEPKLDETVIVEIHKVMEKFPPHQKRSAVLMGLRCIQNHHGHLSDWHMQELAGLLDMTEIEVCEVAEFYDLLTFEKKGRFVIKVCESISCFLCQSGQILGHLQQKLDLEVGQTSKDGLFTIETAPCLAKCADAPVVIVNDESYHLAMTGEKIDVLLANLKAQYNQDKKQNYQNEAES
jgi:NADH-quinone oxidoreductase subunit E